MDDGRGHLAVPNYELRITIYDLRFGKFARRWRGLCNAQALVVGKITGECYEESGGGKAPGGAYLRFTNYKTLDGPV